MNVIVIPSISWRFPLYQRVHHFATILSEQKHNVLFIEPTRTGKNEFVKERLEVYANTIRFGSLSAANIVSTSKNHWLLEALFFQTKKLSNIHFKLISKLRQVLFKTELSPRAIKEYERIFLSYSNSKQKIVLFQAPYLTEFIPFFKKHGFKVVYDLVDEISEFKESPSFFKSGEKTLLKNSDLVIATAFPLLERAKKYNDNVVLIPNGVENKRFVNAREPHPKPDDLKKNPPYVGYYGAIWDWFDYDLLLYLAQSRPNYQFVLIGTIHPSIFDKIKNVPNIQYLGEKKYEVLPNYLSHFSTTIIPFKDTKLVKAINPVKAYEYLSGGKNVVSTPLPEINNVPGIVFADQKEDFLLKLDDSIKNAPDLKKIDSFLKSKTWDFRINKFIMELEQLYKTKIICEQMKISMVDTTNSIFDEVNLKEMTAKNEKILPRIINTQKEEVVQGNPTIIKVKKEDSFAGVLISSRVASPNKTYVLSVTAKGSKDKLLMEFCDYANSNKILMQNAVNTQWSEYSFPFSTPNGAFSLFINLSSFNKILGELSIKEIKIISE
ncbi:MAG: hypothetical protein ACE5DI_01640 [Candidatus Micrarchaeia archaeon]